MARTTLSLDDELYEKIVTLAKQENRSTPNMIETILVRYLEETLFVDDLEMEGIHQDKSLRQSIKKGLGDYKAGRGKIV